MTWLITSDIHLSDRPRDAYRFGLFKWLAEQQNKYNVEATFILGDLTQEKDNHSATLVNRAIDEIATLKPPVYALRGNHDGIDPNTPYFRFINLVDGLSFACNPVMDNNLCVALIPHCRNQTEFDQACKIIKPNSAVMCHQTFDGAIAETGARLSGLKTAALEAKRPWVVWAGDIHKPQQQGIVTYVGSPYHVRFGDEFDPRVILVTDRKQQNLYFDCPRKWVLHIRSANELQQHDDLKKGDQVKINLGLKREDAVDWVKHRRTVYDVCNDLGLEIFGIDLKLIGPKAEERRYHGKQAITPTEVFSDFCQHEGLSNALRTTGQHFIDTTQRVE